MEYGLAGSDLAWQVIEYALHRRGHLFVDIDNTISDAWKRIQRVGVSATAASELQYFTARLTVERKTDQHKTRFGRTS